MRERLGHTVRSLRHRNFQLFFAGQLVSLVGTWMQSVAQSWLVYRMTRSSALLGLVGFASQIPVFLLGPFGGALADRANRRRVLVVTQAASMALALALAALTLSGAVRVWHVFALATLLGVVNAADIPTRQAFVVQMVRREDLMNAIALNSSMFNGARIIGPAIAGILVARLGEGWCFFANGVSYVAVIAGLLAMRLATTAPARMTGSALAHMAEGIRFVAGASPVRALILLLGVVSFVGMPYAVLMPVFAEEVLHRGASGLGLLMGASGAGALIGSLSLAARRGIRGLGTWIAAAGAGFGISAVLFALSRTFWLSALALVPVGLFLMVQMASSNTLIQVMVPDELRGRVMAVYSMMFMGMAPFGSLLAGALAGNVGAPATVAAGGLLSLAASLVFRAWLPRLRSEAREMILANETVAGNPTDAMTGTPAAGSGGEPLGRIRAPVR